MIAFKVELNGQKLATAGITGRAVLNATLTWVRRRVRPPSGEALEERLDFHLGGLDSNVETWEDPHFVNWFHGPVKVGDRLNLEILDIEQVDEPATQRTAPRKPARKTTLAAARHYLRGYREQRAELTRRIRDHERLVKTLEGKRRQKR